MEKPLIMIADDAMFMRRVIKRALTQGGYDNFVEAGDGVEAVEKYKEVQPDLMLLDNEGRKGAAGRTGGRNIAGNGEYRNRKQHGLFIPYYRRKGVLRPSCHEDG